VTTFSASDSNLQAGETATISIVLSEASTTFSVSDISVSGGTLSNFTTTSSTQYSVLFTPTADSESNATLDIAADTFTDGAGNNNTAATQLPITVDTKAPSGHGISFSDSYIPTQKKQRHPLPLAARKWGQHTATPFRAAMVAQR
ncbi:Ig-like domain-containing protein, partial [Pseudoalteromonas luteoviolacea]|uniref:Ig-like domain-containing protein n=1 Tax=Pseudoalteromonas luteoviolacea TaxID=43657 RepID=UPI001C11F390